MLVAVYPDKFDHGVACPEDDWRIPPGRPGNDREVKPGKHGVPCRGVLTHISNALDTRHKTDAHWIPYVMRDPGGNVVRTQPRVNKSGTGLAFVESLGYRLEMSVLCADVDNPNHCDWTPELEALALEDEPRLTTAGVYHTAHGRRIVQPLTRPVPISEVEGVIAGWLRYLEDLGLHPDWSCTDWTRCYRVPHARVKGRGVLDLRKSFGNMTPIDPPAPAAPEKARARRRVERAAALGDIDAAPLARAFDLAGWLGPRLGPDKRAARCPWHANHTIGREFDSSTVLFAATSSQPNGWFHCSHGHCSSRTQRDVAEALPDAARAVLVAAEGAAAPAPARDLVTRDEARERLERAFRSPGDGVSIAVAGCGTGKTEAAIVVALERAALPHAEGSKGERAPKHSKTAISVPTNKLAREVAKRIAAKGGKVRRVFGPLSERDELGAPVCVYFDAATELAKGGISVPFYLCQGGGREACDAAATCRARDGVEGPDDARIVVGPHKMMGALAEAVGTTGLLVVDEPPAMLEHVVITSDDLARAERALIAGRFEDRYAAAMRVVLEALSRWIGTGPLDSATHLSLVALRPDPELLRAAVEATGETDLQAIARAAFPPVLEGKPARRSSAPPVVHAQLMSAKRHTSQARAIGHAARVLRTVWTAMTCDLAQGRVRLEERAQRGGTIARVLVVTLPDPQLLETLTTFEGSTVVADAGGRLHLPVYRAVTGYVPKITEAHVVDGAKIDRLVLKTRASRAGWFEGGRLKVTPALVRAVRLAVEWLLEDESAPAALVTFAPLELALRHAACEDIAPLLVGRDEVADKLPPAVLEDARRLLGPLLRRLRAIPDLGHFGGLRGLDHWKGHGALVTLGDPWTQLSDGKWEAQFLALPSWETRLEAYAAGELEQAHGRLRTVHRSAPARALHVGRVVPGGWERARVREDVGGSRVVRHTADEIRAAVARAGGFKGAARALRVDVKTVRRAVQGGVPTSFKQTD